MTAPPLRFPFQEPQLRELRERAQWSGVDELGDSELLALVLGQGGDGLSAGQMATALLEGSGGLEPLSKLPPAGLAARPGLGPVQATRIAALFELGRRTARRETERRTGLPLSAEAVARWASPRLTRLDHEEVWVLCLDGRSALSCALQVGRGGMHGCALLARDFLIPVVRHAASAFVVVHNHPSGDPTPSREDLEMTVALASAAALVAVPLLDHVVVGRDGHRSLFEMGILDGL